MKQYYSLLITWIFLTLFFSIPLMGFMISFSVIWFFFFIVFQFIKAVKNKLSWKNFIVKISIVLVSYSIIASIHYIHYLNARNYANTVVKQVLDYKHKSGYYPQISEVIIQDKDLFNGKLGYFIDSEDNNQTTNITQEKKLEPQLFYFDTFMIYASYHYNFQKNQWEYEGG